MWGIFYPCILVILADSYYASHVGRLRQTLRHTLRHHLGHSNNSLRHSQDILSITKTKVRIP
jgi:hypothetical protein